MLRTALRQEICPGINAPGMSNPQSCGETAAPHFSVYSGMDLDYWKTYYLLGEAEDVAERISARIAALDGGVDHIVLNPLDWSLEQLELIAAKVLPRVKGGR